MSPLCTCNTILAKRLFLCDQTPYVHRGDDGTRSKPQVDRKLVLRVQAIGAKVTHMYHCSIYCVCFPPKHLGLPGGGDYDFPSNLEWR